MKAHELIAKPENWTQHCGARDKNGDPIHWGDGAATCWCLLGAVWKCYPPWQEMSVRHRIYTELGDKGISDFNDTHTHQEVYDLLKRLDI